MWRLVVELDRIDSHETEDRSSATRTNLPGTTSTFHVHLLCLNSDFPLPPNQTGGSLNPPDLTPPSPTLYLSPSHHLILNSSDLLFSAITLAPCVCSSPGSTIAMPSASTPPRFTYSSRPPPRRPITSTYNTGSPHRSPLGRVLARCLSINRREALNRASLPHRTSAPAAETPATTPARRTPDSMGSTSWYDRDLPTDRRRTVPVPTKGNVYRHSELNAPSTSSPGTSELSIGDSTLMLRSAMKKPPSSSTPPQPPTKPPALGPRPLPTGTKLSREQIASFRRASANASTARQAPPSLAPPLPPPPPPGADKGKGKETPLPRPPLPVPRPPTPPRPYRARILQPPKYTTSVLTPTAFTATPANTAAQTRTPPKPTIKVRNLPLHTVPPPKKVPVPHPRLPTPPRRSVRTITSTKPSYTPPAQPFTLDGNKRTFLPPAAERSAATDTSSVPKPSNPTSVRVAEIRRRLASSRSRPEMRSRHSHSSIEGPYWKGDLEFNRNAIDPALKLGIHFHGRDGPAVNLAAKPQRDHSIESHSSPSRLNNPLPPLPLQSAKRSLSSESDVSKPTVRTPAMSIEQTIQSDRQPSTKKDTLPASIIDLPSPPSSVPVTPVLRNSELSGPASLDELFIHVMAAWKIDDDELPEPQVTAVWKGKDKSQVDREHTSKPARGRQAPTSDRGTSRSNSPHRRQSSVTAPVSLEPPLPKAVCRRIQERDRFIAANRSFEPLRSIRHFSSSFATSSTISETVLRNVRPPNGKIKDVVAKFERAVRFNLPIDLNKTSLS